MKYVILAIVLAGCAKAQPPLDLSDVLAEHEVVSLPDTATAEAVDVTTAADATSAAD